MWSNFQYQASVAVSGSLGGKTPRFDDEFLSHEQKYCPTTSLNQNCIKFDFQMDRSSYNDFGQTCLVLELKIVKGRGYGNDKTKETKKEHKEETKANEETKEGQEAPAPLATHVNHILLSIFSIVEVHVNNQQIYNSNGLYVQVLHCQKFQ